MIYSQALPNMVAHKLYSIMQPLPKLHFIICLKLEVPIFMKIMVCTYYENITYDCITITIAHPYQCHLKTCRVIVALAVVVVVVVQQRIDNSHIQQSLK